MKKLFLLTIVIALCLGAGAIIQSGRGSGASQNSSVGASQATSGPFRDGLYLGKRAAESGGGSHISSGRWATEADRASFTAGFQQGYQGKIVLRAAKGSAN